MNSARTAVVLLSGGIDSATCAAIARDAGFAVHAMSFRYGQRHHIELAAAQRVAEHIGVAAHRIVEIDLAAFGGSVLTRPGEVPHHRNMAAPETEIPPTYVPARNTIFLAFALAWAEVLHSHDIYIGATAVDYSGYPDCRPEYIAAWQTLANLATRMGVEGETITIHAPLISMTKAQIITTGASHGVDFSLTHSCYDPTDNGMACGVCDSCRIRRAGFIQAEVPDPTRYAEP